MYAYIFTVILCFHSVLCRGLWQELFKKPLLRARENKEFREVRTQEVLAAPLLQVSETAGGMVKKLLKACKCSLKREKPTSSNKNCLRFGRVYIGRGLTRSADKGG